MMLLCLFDLEYQLSTSIVYHEYLHNYRVHHSIPKFVYTIISTADLVINMLAILSEI